MAVYSSKLCKETMDELMYGMSLPDFLDLREAIQEVESYRAEYQYNASKKTTRGD